MAKVELVKIGKRYGDVEVVQCADLVINDNEFIVLIGPSGCGKSTILRMIAGLESISSGEIRIGDRVVNNVPPKDRNVAMVFQNYALYPHMTVAENMGFSLKMQKKSVEDTARKVHEAADILELTPYLQRKPAELSGGQRQRVAMGRAIVRNAEVFLFDEPLSNLDAQLRTQMRLELKKLHMRLKTTTVYVTHDQIEAMTLADRIVILKGGDIQQVGTPLEVFEQPANVFVGQFIGNPPMNILEGTVVAAAGMRGVRVGNVVLPLPEYKYSKVKHDQPVLAGIRPDAIKTGDAMHRLPESWRFLARVGLSEMLGSHSLLELNLGGSDLLAEVEGQMVNTAGQELEVGVDANRMVLFDPQTTNAL